MNHVITPGTNHINASPTGFHLWAEQFYQCRRDFKQPGHFSPVPYFLLCRSIELELKSRQLVHQRVGQVKKGFGHNLARLYGALPDDQKILSKEQMQALSQASVIYNGKGFEYFSAYDAGRGYSHLPNIEILDSIAQMLITAELQR